MYTLFWNQTPEEVFFKSQFNYFHEHPSTVVSLLLDKYSKQNLVYLFTLFFIRETDETVNENEEFIIHKKVIKSPHDINSYTSLTLKDDSIETLS